MPAPGYPACPNHTEKATLFRLLDATKNADIQLTEGLSMYPAAAVPGWYFSHPESQYSVVGKLTKDQVEGYARRKVGPSPKPSAGCLPTSTTIPTDEVPTRRP